MSDSRYMYICSYRCKNCNAKFDYSKDVSDMPPLIDVLGGLVGKFFAKCPNCGSGWIRLKKTKYALDGIFSVDAKPTDVIKKRPKRARPLPRFDEGPILPMADREEETEARPKT